MSFDLGFWWERQVISPAVAAQKYRAMIDGESGVADVNPALEAFYVELTGHLPDLTEENFEASPWAAPLYLTGECLIVSIAYSQQTETSKYLRELASRRGIVCYDPQSEKVYSPKDVSPATLELSNGSIIGEPSQGDINRALSGLSSEDWYVILEIRPGWFIQVGFGVPAGVLAGSYALEFKEGTEDKHFRVVVGDVAIVIDAFHRFLSRDSSWRAGLNFTPVSY